MQIIIIEDSDSIFDRMHQRLSQAGITEFRRVDHGRAAFLLMDEVEEKVIWIVDGLFPLFEGEKDKIRELWPDAVRYIREVRDESEPIIGFSSDPTIFDDVSKDMDHVFDKDRFCASMRMIIKFILSNSERK